MRVAIRDTEALKAVSPAALAAYARAAGWSKAETYGDHSDVYVAHGRPEIILPRTERLGDYASVVAMLIETFAQTSGQDELTVYRLLVVADRDVIRVRVAESDDGSVTLSGGADLIGGARDMLLSAACSLRDPRPVYRAGANREAADLLKRVRLGQTDQGSFVVTLLMPALLPPMPALPPDPDDRNAPIERRMTRRLVEALGAVREAVERTVAGEEGAFGGSVASGVSANLCEALARIIEPFFDAGCGHLVGAHPADEGIGNRRSLWPRGYGRSAGSRAAVSRPRAAAGRAPSRLRSASEARAGGHRRHDRSGGGRRRSAAVGRGGSGARGLRAGGSGPP